MIAATWGDSDNFMTFGKSCISGYGQSKKGHIKFCCKKNVANGACKICKSCGGGYNTMAGAIGIKDGS